MPRIPSPPNFDALPAPSTDPHYRHPATSRKGVIPLAFQITSPFNRRLSLMPHALVMHVNPNSFAENPTKKVERIQTRGGFVEQHWGDELTEISADGSTGAFMDLYRGLSSVVRQRTIAWDRYRDLLDLYYNNGSVYDPFGNIVLQGNVMLMYDKGTYIGYFSNFTVEETGDSPFTFSLSWTFKVEETIMKLPVYLSGDNKTSTYEMGIKAPTFQQINAPVIPTDLSGIDENAGLSAVDLIRESLTPEQLAEVERQGRINDMKDEVESILVPDPPPTIPTKSAATSGKPVSGKAPTRPVTTTPAKPPGKVIIKA